ncbi:MAG: hypothetical protein ABI539_06230 [Acidobacteriota bacterium]
MARFNSVENSTLPEGTIGFGGYAAPNRRRPWLRIFAVAATAVVSITLLAGYLYWQSLKSTPEYSLALIVDAARANDQGSVDALVDSNALVEDFMPQVTSKAIELYGRGQPPEVIAKVGKIAQPLMPAVKERVRIEMPKLIRRKTERLRSVPFEAIVLGAGRYLDVKTDGDKATVSSLDEGQPFEVTMTRRGERWVITGVRDEPIATDIARAIGQEVIAVASNGGTENGQRNPGLKNLAETLKRAENFFNK